MDREPWCVLVVHMGAVGATTIYIVFMEANSIRMKSVLPPAYTGRVVVISMGQIGNRAAPDPPNGCRR
jgi:hypothetical protein